MFATALRSSLFVAAGALAVACGGSELGEGGDGDAGGRFDAAPRIDAGTQTPDGGAQSTAVRFVVMGDVGEGNDEQKAVADVIKTVCDAQGCDFVIMLGDNFYDSGVSSTTDPLWESAFEEPYRNLDLPFYVVLGNHDYGGTLLGSEQGGLGNEWEKGPIEVMYTDTPGTKWNMPDTYYTFTWGKVGFIMLDTNSLLWDNTDHGDQRAWYPTALMEVSGAEWIFAAGHHPVRSNGAHGNAGNYEAIEVAGVEIPIPIPQLAGWDLKDFFDNTMCGTVDVYLAGHDHNRQWINEPEACGGAELFVSGAGAKTKGFKDRGNAHRYQDASTPGFFYMVVEGNTLTAQAWDMNGVMNFEDSVTR